MLNYLFTRSFVLHEGINTCNAANALLNCDNSAVSNFLTQNNDGRIQVIPRTMLLKLINEYDHRILTRAFIALMIKMDGDKSISNTLHPFPFDQVIIDCLGSLNSEPKQQVNSFGWIVSTIFTTVLQGLPQDLTHITPAQEAERSLMLQYLFNIVAAALNFLSSTAGIMWLSDLLLTLSLQHVDIGGLIAMGNCSQNWAQIYNIADYTTKYTTLRDHIIPLPVRLQANWTDVTAIFADNRTYQNPTFGVNCNFIINNLRLMMMTDPSNKTNHLGIRFPVIAPPDQDRDWRPISPLIPESVISEQLRLLTPFICSYYDRKWKGTNDVAYLNDIGYPRAALGTSVVVNEICDNTYPTILNLFATKRPTLPLSGSMQINFFEDLRILRLNYLLPFLSFNYEQHSLLIDIFEYWVTIERRYFCMTNSTFPNLGFLLNTEVGEMDSMVPYYYNEYTRPDLDRVVNVLQDMRTLLMSSITDTSLMLNFDYKLLASFISNRNIEETYIECVDTEFFVTRRDYLLIDANSGLRKSAQHKLIN